MNNRKRSSLMRLIAFFLVAIILVCTFGFTTDGWNISDKIAGESAGSNKKPTQTPPNDLTTNGGSDNTPPQIVIPEYINSLTGLETTNELSLLRPISFVMNPDSPLYGTSSSDILVELPIENGKTRLIAITTNYKTLWKIGSLAPTRVYISNIAKYFGSAIISNGSDDSISYLGCDMSSDTVDLSASKDYCYSEYSYYLYTNTNLVNAAVSYLNISTDISDKFSLPFIHNPYENEEIESDTAAESISITYSSLSTTELIFSKESGKYTLSKNGVDCIDLLTNAKHEYKNCFILFADSVTYENTDGTQTVMNTIGCGTGYYFTEGSVTEISWVSDTDGNMIFYDSLGERLTVNRGNSYINIIKSSRINTVSFT